VSAGLEHQKPAQILTVLSQPRELVHHGAPLDRWSPFHHEPHRFAGNLGVNGPDSAHQ
jgi:hypothetical protein